MLEAVLTRANVKLSVKISIKTVVSVVLVAMAVGLPQLVHLVAGASGGVTWLPMYLPVLLAGAILGPWWGLGVGVASPIVSYLITSAVGNAMPALERLPFMIAELAVFATVSGLFSEKITKNQWLAFPAILLAQVAGRTAFIALVAIFGGLTNLSVAMVWSQIQTGMLGLVVQAVILPFIIIGLNKILMKEKTNE